ncbi:MAG: LysM peptidoglycan-binding domain-containing protein [Spirochaetaceae bacterium]|jgi:LysM repeat protein|nr:LysM peptidoglycan-binding domain-containing protein [Spirochaetaceae bacterium]
MISKRIFLSLVLASLGSYAFSADIEPGYQDIYDKIANPDMYERYLPRSKAIQLQAIRQTLQDNKYDINHILQASKPMIDELDAIVLRNLADRLDVAGMKYERIRNSSPALQAEYAGFIQKKETAPEYLVTKAGMEDIEAFINRVDELYAQANWQDVPPPGSQPNEAGTVYLVKTGDFLRKIAQNIYGDERRWSLIYRANPQIKHPDLIYPGMEFRIPSQ